MATSSMKNISIAVLSLLLFGWKADCQLVQDSIVTEKSADDDNASGIEEEVLGPLRIWHIVFICASILLGILVVICCCLDIRVPRTRQEIEYNYHKRMTNKKYVRMLERTPDKILQQHRDSTASKDRRLETISQLVVSKTAFKTPKTGAGGSRLKNAVEKSRALTGGNNTDDMVGGKGRPFKNGIGTPLPVNPRDILALVAQQKKASQQ